MDQVVHFEIPAANVARAKKFYTSVFGWEANSIPKMDYTMLKTVATNPKTMMPKEVGAINGGMMKRGAALQHPRIIIDVSNLEKSMAKLVKAGGKKVISKKKVGDMGWLVYAKDSEGNVIGIWQDQ